MDLSDMMAADAAPKNQSAAEMNLGLVSYIAATLSATVREIEDIEQLLKDKKKELDRLQYEALPQAMSELGLEKVVLEDGSAISVATEYYAAISKKNADVAYSWLRDNGFGDLIKSEIKMNFGRGEEDTADHVKELMSEENIPFSEKDSVHWQTLRAFVKEQIEAGEPIPMDTFSIHISNKASIKK